MVIFLLICHMTIKRKHLLLFPNSCFQYIHIYDLLYVEINNYKYLAIIELMYGYGYVNVFSLHALHIVRPGINLRPYGYTVTPLCFLNIPYFKCSQCFVANHIYLQIMAISCTLQDVTIVKTSRLVSQYILERYSTS